MPQSHTIIISGFAGFGPGPAAAAYCLYIRDNGSNISAEAGRFRIVVGGDYVHVTDGVTYGVRRLGPS